MFARASLFTGLYAHQHNLLLTMLPAFEDSGEVAVQPVLSPVFPTIASVLNTMGYVSTYMGKWHLSYPASHRNSIAGYAPPDKQHLQHLFSNGYLGPYGFAGGTYPDPIGEGPSTGELFDPQICDGFTTWNRTIRPGIVKPWFTVVSLVEPHDAQFFWDGIENNPFKPSSAYPNYVEEVASYAPEGSVLPLYRKPAANLENYAAGFRESIYTIYSGGQVNDIVNGAISFDINSSQMSVRLIDPPPVESNAPRYTIVAPYAYWAKTLDYYAYLHIKLDESFGRILADVDAMPVASRPLIVFTSDHGEYAGSHGLRGKGFTGFRESTHVPLYVYDPNMTSGFVPGVRRAMTSSVDVLPLVCSLAAGESSTWLQRNTVYSGSWSNRLKLYDALFNPNFAGRSYLLHTYDETATGELDQYGNPTPYHMVCYRTPSTMICAYSSWDENTQQINVASTKYTAYALNGTLGALELVPTTPTSQQRSAVTSAITNELRARLPTAQQAAARNANTDRVRFLDSVIWQALPGVVWEIIDW
jgi:arylsulfatase A-like enzyme